MKNELNYKEKNHCFRNFSCTPSKGISLTARLDFGIKGAMKLLAISLSPGPIGPYCNLNLLISITINHVDNTSVRESIPFFPFNYE